MALCLTVVMVAPAGAALAPPPVRLALLFEREKWAPTALPHRPVPLLYGAGPIAYEVP